MEAGGGRGGQGADVAEAGDQGGEVGDGGGAGHDLSVPGGGVISRSWSVLLGGGGNKRSLGVGTWGRWGAGVSGWPGARNPASSLPGQRR